MLAFEFWQFPPIFVLFKLTCLVTLFDRKLQVFKSSAKWTIFAICNNLLSTLNVNVAGFARNVECDLFLWSSNTVVLRKSFVFHLSYTRKKSNESRFSSSAPQLYPPNTNEENVLLCVLLKRQPQLITSQRVYCATRFIIREESFLESPPLFFFPAIYYDPLFYSFSPFVINFFNDYHLAVKRKKEAIYVLHKKGCVSDFVYSDFVVFKRRIESRA